jgi:hypothetical protein
MNDFPATDMITKSERIEETALTLHQVSLQIAEMQRIKEELDKRLNALLEHSDDCQTTYTHGRWKITVKSGYIYSLDKEEYDTIGHFLPKGLDPVNKVTKYELNKNVIKACRSLGSKEENELLDQFVTRKPSKIHIKVYPGVTR